jgi:hypothetical protein
MPNKTQSAAKEKSAIRRGSNMQVTCVIAFSDNSSRGKSDRLALILVKKWPIWIFTRNASVHPTDLDFALQIPDGWVFSGVHHFMNFSLWRRSGSRKHRSGSLNSTGYFIMCARAKICRFNHLMVLAIR